MSHSVILYYACLAVLATGRGALAYDWWMNQPYGETSFNHLAMYNDNVTLECNDTMLPDGYSFQYWFRPDLKVMRGGDSEEFWTLDGTAGWAVNATTDNMEIYTLQENQFGFYHCILNNSEGSVYVVKKAINYEEPYYGDTWEKYKKNTIIAGSAAGGFLVLAIIVLIVCKCKYEEEEDDSYSLKDLDLEDPLEGGSSSRSGSTIEPGSLEQKVMPPDGPHAYLNKAMIMDDPLVPGYDTLNMDVPQVNAYEVVNMGGLQENDEPMDLAQAVDTIGKAVDAIEKAVDVIESPPSIGSDLSEPKPQLKEETTAF